MATKNKTTETENSVAQFLATIADAKKRSDCSEIVDMIQKQSKLDPKMWGASIIGFGSYHYQYESGREGDAPLVALSPRANAITLYLGSSFDKREELLSKFGKYKEGKGCIYIQKLEDIDNKILMQMIKNSIAQRKKEKSC
jgi:hypothetical protein